MAKVTKPKVLTWDIETWPIIAKIWRLYDINVGVDQIITSSSIACIALKWQGSDRVYWTSTKKQKDARDDRKVVAQAADMINDAHEIVTQNGVKFDLPILIGRLAVHGIPAPAVPRHHDTRVMGKRAGYPSAKLAFLTRTLCPELEKGTHKKFPGQLLWDECEVGNPAAWKEMEKYNKLDVRGTERVFEKLSPYMNVPRLDVFNSDMNWVCRCGSTEWAENGHQYTSTGVFKRYRCKKCGANAQEKGAVNNLLTLSKRAAMKKGA